MQAYILLPLAVIASLSYQGACKESLAEDSNSASSSTSDHAHNELSRAKRESLKMLRLGRGLHMLRLGKRGGEDQTDDSDNLLNERLEELYNEAGDLYPLSDLDTFALSRYRRSTPPSDGVVDSDSLQKGSSEFSDIDPSDIGEDEGFYGLYPEDFLEGNLEEYLQPEEGGIAKRPMSMLRLGKRDGEDSLPAEEEQDFDNGVEKRTLSMLRLGKRPMSMLRLGKRPMSMLRLGKRPMSMLRLGKRPMSMLRLGKRPMSMLRLGKRPMSMLRLGKRPMSMLRLGKRPMSMLRLGKRPMSMLRLGKRPMSMLRLGKRPMSMLRLGKRESEEKEKRPMSMLRLGKRSSQ